MCVSGMRGKKTESRLGENSIITISEQQKRRYSGGGGMRKIAGREATSHSVSHLGSPEDDSDELISSYMETLLALSWRLLNVKKRRT